MKKSRLLFIVFLLGLLTYSGQVAAQDKGPFKVEINVEQESVKLFGGEPIVAMIYMGGDGMSDVFASAVFRVQVKITNNSGSDQVIEVPVCKDYTFNWSSDIRGSVINDLGTKDCGEDKLGKQDVVLKPGEAYAKNLEILLPRNISSGALKFRLAFRPKGLLTAKHEYIWSNPLTINLQAPSDAERALWEEKIRKRHEEEMKANPAPGPKFVPSIQGQL